jgi:hypothetical protein
MNDRNILIMPFMDESESYTNGFEAGQLWEQMSSSIPIKDRAVHSDNAEQIKLICDHFGYQYKLDFSGEGWQILNANPVDISFIKT